jgi:hypothetical protein
VVWGAGIGILLAGLWCLIGLPEAASPSDRAHWWATILLGPISWFWIAGPIGCPHIVGWCAVPAILAHPVKPNHATAVITVIGLVAWFATGWIAALFGVWGK